MERGRELSPEMAPCMAWRVGAEWKLLAWLGIWLDLVLEPFFMSE